MNYTVIEVDFIHVYRNEQANLYIITISRKISYMIQKLCRAVLFSWLGLKEEVDQPRPPKWIICVAPHTSNYDFLIGKAYYTAIGLTSNFLMKKEWFVGPLGYIFKKMGGIPVERSKHTSMTDQLAEVARKSANFSLAVTPEGTRSKVTQWKRGFYYIALKANIPILLYAIDYPTKRIVCKRTIHPSGDIEADMRSIMEYYKDFNGKYPEKFAIEQL